MNNKQYKMSSEHTHACVCNTNSVTMFFYECKTHSCEPTISVFVLQQQNLFEEKCSWDKYKRRNRLS